VFRRMLRLLLLHDSQNSFVGFRNPFELRAVRVYARIEDISRYEDSPGDDDASTPPVTSAVKKPQSTDLIDFLSGPDYAKRATGYDFLYGVCVSMSAQAPFANRPTAPTPQPLLSVPSTSSTQVPSRSPRTLPRPPGPPPVLYPTTGRSSGSAPKVWHELFCSPSFLIPHLVVRGMQKPATQQAREYSHYRQRSLVDVSALVQG